MKVNKVLYVVCFLAVFSACSSDKYELKKTVFIPDPELPMLPIYSEWGYNTFGVFYDRTPFIADEVVAPSKFIVSEDSISFELTGNLLTGTFSETGSKLIFRIPNLQPELYEELLVLDQQVLDLVEDGVSVYFQHDHDFNKLQVIEGRLDFVRAQHLFIDTRPMQVILSGKFDFRAVVNGSPVSFSDGRFDIGVTDDNFYNLH